MGYKLETHIYRMLHILSQKNCARFFKYPVDVEAYECQDYYDVISRPMDLNTLKFNFREGKYTTLEQVEHDLQLIVENCQYYNGQNHNLYKMAISFRDRVKTQIAQILNIYEKEDLSLQYEFQIDQKELDLCDRRYFNAMEKTFMDDSQYYDQLFNLETESEQIIKWLTDFIKLKVFNLSSFDKIVGMYKIGKLKTIGDIYKYMHKHLDVACHREFHSHFDSLMINLKKLKDNEQKQVQEEKPKNPNQFTIRFKTIKKDKKQTL